MSLRRAGLVLVLLAGCSRAAAKQAGEECVASSECAPGLVCDLGAEPPVCAGNLTLGAREVDAPDVDAAEIDATEIDAAEIDARVIDAAMIDARVIDATVIDAATDAAIDAPDVDAATDAAIDAPP